MIRWFHRWLVEREKRKKIKAVAREEARRLAKWCGHPSCLCCCKRHCRHGAWERERQDIEREKNEEKST
jgi:hypothetical protein